MLLEMFFAVSLITPGLFLLQIFGTKTRNIVERLILSYITSLVTLFIVLFIGGMLMSFIVTSLLYVVIVVLSIIYLGIKGIKKTRSIASVRSILSEISKEHLILSISVIALLSIYSVILLSRALLDSDVVQYYLPFAREIVRGGGFTYSTGYDYNTFLKPIGVSVIYAWTYAISGSLLVESFRLMPLVPILMMILLTYSISLEATESERIATVATIIFMLLPFHDRFLHYNAFYPDTFYYPLILSVIYGVLRYSKTRDVHLLFIIGCVFGIAGLIKAQTILYFFAFLLCLMVIEIKNRKFVFLFVLLTPFGILVPNILAEIGHPNSTGFALAAESAVLMLFAAVVIAVLYIFIEPKSSVGIPSEESPAIETPQITQSYSVSPSDQSAPENSEPHLVNMLLIYIGRALVVIIPFVMLAGMWYLNNLLRYGSLIYTSSIDIPNIEWAVNIVNSVLDTNAGVGYRTYLAYFFFLFIDPAVMGYIWLIPLLLGFVLVMMRDMKNGLALLMFFTVVAVCLIFSQTAYYINPYNDSVVNPRDLIPVATLLSIVASISFCTLASSKRFGLPSRGKLIIPLLFAVYFGFMSYLHSVYLYFATLVLPHLTYLISGVLMLFGLSLQQTSFQLYPADRVPFFSSYLVSIIGLALVVAFPLILFAVINQVRSILDSRNENFGFVQSIHEGYNLIVNRIRSLNMLNTQIVKTLGIVLLISSVIILPRTLILVSQGGYSNSQDFQSSLYYGSINELFMNHDSIIHGDILTYSGPTGLQYYISDVNIVDLRYAANLAYLRDSFNTSTVYDAALSLRQKGIRHLLLNLELISDLDNALNNTLISIAGNSSLAQISQTYGKWILYDLGPFELAKTVISPSSWEIDARYTVGPVIFNANETGINLELSTGASSDRLSLVNYDLPKLDLTSFNYLVVNISGPTNARVSLRLYLENDTALDIAYWHEPSQIAYLDLTSFDNNYIRGDAYMSLISSDGQPTWITVGELAFVEVIPISQKDDIPLDNWLIDFRYTTGSYNFTSNDTELVLGLTTGALGDRLTVSSTEVPQVSVSTYNYLILDLQGSDNAQILFRIFLENGTSLDISYWVAPNYFQSMILLPQIDDIFGGSVFFGLMSSDGNPCSITITELVLLRTDRLY